MLKSDRKDVILRELRRTGSVQTNELASRLGISLITARRDLVEMESEGKLRRVYGGAIVTGTPLTASSGLGGEIVGSLPKTTTLGMVVPTSEYYFRTVISGAIDAARAAGVRVVLGVSRYSTQAEMQLVRRMLEIDVDALLVTPSETSFEDTPLVETMTASRVPVVLLERTLSEPAVHPSIDSIRTNHELGAQLAVRHLAAAGRKKIALLRFPNATSGRLETGWAEALRSLNLPVSDIDMELDPDAQHAWALDAQHDLSSRYLQRLIDEQVDGIIVNPDQHGLALTRIARERGVSVPEDLAVVAYDDEVASLSEVPLTAVSPPKRDLGRSAIELCVRRILEASTGTPSAAQHVALSPGLIVRESTPAIPGEGGLPFDSPQPHAVLR